MDDCLKRFRNNTICNLSLRTKYNRDRIIVVGVSRDLNFTLRNIVKEIY